MKTNWTAPFWIRRSGLAAVFEMRTEAQAKTANQPRHGNVLPLTLVIMMVASLLNMQATQAIIAQQRDIFARFETRQALEWIEFGKIRIRKQRQEDAKYAGETISVTEIASEDITLSRLNSAFRILIEPRQSGPTDSNDPGEWEIKVLQGDGAAAKIKASWRGMSKIESS